jgi:hypothetical protein
MNTTQVAEFLKKDKYTKKIFKGVLPIDHLPLKYIRRPSCFIVNTGRSDTEGEHWVALYLPVKGPIEYFDSYGYLPINKEIYTFFKLNQKKFIYNRFNIQSDKSTNCGKYAIFYLYMRCRRFSLYKFIQFFVKHKYINDKIISKIFTKINKIF